MDGSKQSSALATKKVVIGAAVVIISCLLIGSIIYLMNRVSSLEETNKTLTAQKEAAKKSDNAKPSTSASSPDTTSPTEQQPIDDTRPVEADESIRSYRGDNLLAKCLSGNINDSDNYDGSPVDRALADFNHDGVVDALVSSVLPGTARSATACIYTVRGGDGQLSLVWKLPDADILWHSSISLSGNDKVRLTGVKPNETTQKTYEYTWSDSMGSLYRTEL